MILPGVIASSGAVSAPGSYESIATSSPSGVNTITLSSIPGTFSHLQIRILSNQSSGGSLIVGNFNGDTAANYTWHELNGQGSVASQYNGLSQTYARMFGRNIGTSSSTPTALIVDIVDYAKTTKYKVVKDLAGMTTGGTGEISITSSMWMNTAAITSITIKTHDGVNFQSGTKIALYGVKG